MERILSTIEFESGDTSTLSLDKQFREFAQRPFNFDTGSLVRIRVLQDDGLGTVVFLGAHQFVSDGAALDLMLRDLLFPQTIANNRPPYSRFIEWERDLLREKQSDLLRCFRHTAK